VVAEVRERLAMNKQGSHRFCMESFNLKKVKSSIVLRSQKRLQLWKIWTLRWIVIVLEKLLERI
jgi:hypothetical protein